MPNPPRAPCTYHLKIKRNKSLHVAPPPPPSAATRSALPLSARRPQPLPPLPSHARSTPQPVSRDKRCRNDALCSRAGGLQQSKRATTGRCQRLPAHCSVTFCCPSPIARRHRPPPCCARGAHRALQRKPAPRERGQCGAFQGDLSSNLQHPMARAHDPRASFRPRA
jgi:hypothetical protein